MDSFFEEIIIKVKKKGLLRRKATLIISLFVLAFVYNLLLLPTNLVIGGANGLAILINYVYEIDSAIMIFLISLSCLLFGFMYLGKEKVTNSVIATFLYPLFIILTSVITQNIKLNYEDMFLIIIFAGIIGGLANGLIYKTGFSTGGLHIIGQIINKYFKIPTARVNLIIDSIIIILGSFFFGWDILMYAMILIFINNLMIDKVLLGVSRNKAFYIVTSKEKEIREYIVNKLHHTTTVFNVKGAFLEKPRKVLLLAAPTRDYYKITEGIKLIDPEVFFVVEDAYEVKGGK